MAKVPLENLAQHFRRLVKDPATRELTDGQLLARFQTARDENAFQALVQRHGAMVTGVCRRILYDAHDVEDAFQAVFLALIRKANRLDKRPSLSNWLFTVARLVALEMKRKEIGRQAREAKARSRSPADPLSEVTVRELYGLLDEELGRLPEKYRVPLLLCYLEGKTRDEAARQLGWKVSTLKDRLERGRDLLHARLTRRGLTLSAGLLATLLSQPAANAAVPLLLLNATVKSALLLAAAKTSAAIPAQALAATESVLRGMAVAKLKLAGVVLLAAGLLTGGGLTAYRTVPGLLAADNKQNPTPQPAPVAVKPPELAKEAEKKEELDNLPRSAQSIDAEKLLPPTSLRLVYKDTPLDEALAHLADKTGCSLIFTERKAAPADKKITLDTGPTSFWIALDRFCREAGLTCSDTSDGISRTGDDRLRERVPAFSPKARPGIWGSHGVLFLGNAETEPPATCFAGALRIRGLRPRTGQLKPEGNPLFLLEIKGEPKVPSVQFLGLTIESAVDDQDQNLTRQDTAQGRLPLRSPRVLRNPKVGEPLPIVRFTAGNKPSKVIKTLQGTIELQVQKPPDILMTVDNILQAAGKSVKGLDGESLKVIEVGRPDDGTIKVQIEMTLRLSNGYTFPRPFPGSDLEKLKALVPDPGNEPGVQTQFLGLSLVDDKGQGFQIVKTENSPQKGVGNRATFNFALVYKPLKNQGEAVKLIFAASRRMIVKIPVVLRNVPLAVSPNPGKGQS